MSLAELDTKKSIKVIWLSEDALKEVSQCVPLSFYFLTQMQELYEVLVPKNGNVDDLVAGLIKKASIDDEEKAGPIRVYEVHSNKIHKELPREHGVAGITDFIQVVAERIPKEDLQGGPNDFIYVFHFHNEPSKSHGIPFKFHIFEVFA